MSGLINTGNNGLVGSFPSTATGATVTSGTNPRAWTVTFTGGTITAYAVCVPT